MMLYKSIIILSTYVGITNGLVIGSKRCGTESLSASDVKSAVSISHDPNLNRRQMVKDMCTMLSVPVLLSGAPTPVFADVSDGNALPQGAAQFQRVLRAKSDLAGVQKRVAGYSSEMDKKEWDNIGQFLRKVYATSEDMKAISAGFYDPEKEKKAAALIDDIKKLSKAADASTGSQNGPEFLAYSKKISSSFDEFFELLQDVPDEL